MPVNIYPEPTNRFDTKAIAFKCWINDDWHRVGYIVREALDNVHDAIRTKREVCMGKISCQMDTVWSRILCRDQYH